MSFRQLTTYALSSTINEVNTSLCSTQESSSNPQAKIQEYFEGLHGEIVSILENNASSVETIRRLETDLEAFKRAYLQLESEKQRLQLEYERQKLELHSQLKGHRVIALLDGDGAIFNFDLIAQGQAGGLSAAQKLTSAIREHLAASDGFDNYQLWVYVFLNKRGLMDTFGRIGRLVEKSKVDEFIIGFNQAAERFIMVDVGTTKEGVDAKIKVLLDDIKLPQTEKIIFGGCHDNGYVTTIRSQITAGFKHKLILLQSYTDMAAGIRELNLPSFNIPDLFIPQKIGSPIFPYFPQVASTPIMPPHDPRLRNSPFTKALQKDLYLDDTPLLSTEKLDITCDKEDVSPRSYSSIVLAPVRRLRTAELDSSTSSSEQSDESSANLQVPFSNGFTRRVNPKIPLSKQKPPPCTLFYLSTCKHGADCKYGHDYILEAEHYQEIRVNARKSPCPMKNKGEICTWGEECCYGHYCPLATKCHFLKQNRCKFVGGDMHKDGKV